MRAHIVVAHPEPQSYNAHLASTAREALERRGCEVTVSDLYQMQFDPCERASHYAAPLEPQRFDVQTEQRHASNTDAIPPDVAVEIARLDQADLLILQYPMWWHLPPAMLKGWLDRVFIYGRVYTSKQRFENGRFVSKKAMLSVTVGTNEDTYAYNGRSGDIDLLLWPVNFSLAYVGYTVLKPFVAYGVEAGCATRTPPRSTHVCKRSPGSGRRRSPASSRFPRSPSIACLTGAAVAASCPTRQSTHRSSAAPSIWC